MKKDNIQQLKKHVQQKLQGTKKIVNQLWFKLSLVLLVAMFLSQQNLNFQFSINSQQFAANQSSPQLTKNVVNTSTMSSVPTNNSKVEQANIVKTAPPRKLTKQELALHKKRLAYIDRFKSVAITERKKYGIPAAITLAQGIIESSQGDSRLATQNNNHFGIKCFSKKCKKDHCRNFSDDHHKDFFINYKTAWESYRSHSKLLNGKRYKHLQKLSNTDYKSWAHGLKKAGYATDKKYAEKLIKVIEKLDLAILDEVD